MNWNNYLLDKKAPVSSFSHLSIIKEAVKGVYDLSDFAAKTHIAVLYTSSKKFILKYANYDSLAENAEIEGVYLDYIDNNRLSILSSLPNLKYLQISSSRQEDVPDLSPLKTLDVLVLANMMKLRDIECVKRLENLKTLSLYGINKLYDLTPLSNLISLQELSIHHGKTSSKGNPVNSMEPLGKLTRLKYLEFHLIVEGNNKDISAIFNLKNLQHLGLMEKYQKKGQWELLLHKLPLLRDF